jgi:hypothetical protein
MTRRLLLASVGKGESCQDSQKLLDRLTPSRSPDGLVPKDALHAHVPGEILSNPYLCASNSFTVKAPVVKVPTTAALRFRSVVIFVTLTGSSCPDQRTS